VTARSGGVAWLPAYRRVEDLREDNAQASPSQKAVPDVTGTAFDALGSAVSSSMAASVPESLPES
jgi:hypothetical protein